MDAKSRANFINSVAGGQKIPCPKCNTLNESDSRFCITCGVPIGQAEAPAQKPEKAKTVQPSAAKPFVKVEEPAEESSIFAEGLPAWDIVPPQVMVRRKKR